MFKEKIVIGNVFNQLDKTTLEQQLDNTFGQLDKMFDGEYFNTAKVVTKDATDASLSFDGDFPSFPPVNIYSYENTIDPVTFLPATFDTYIIELALSGYKSEDVSVLVQETNSVKTLVIESTGVNNQRKPNNEIKWHQRGIAGRAFRLKFKLANNITVRSANLYDGLLSISLTVDPPVKTSGVVTIPVNGR